LNRAQASVVRSSKASVGTPQRWNIGLTVRERRRTPQSANVLPRCGVPTVVSDSTRSSISRWEIMYRASSPPMLWAMRCTFSPGNRSSMNRLSSAARWATPRVLLRLGTATRWPAASRASSIPGK
jgi:hypothetical protein